MAALTLNFFCTPNISVTWVICSFLSHASFHSNKPKSSPDWYPEIFSYSLLLSPGQVLIFSSLDNYISQLGPSVFDLMTVHIHALHTYALIIPIIRNPGSYRVMGTYMMCHPVSSLASLFLTPGTLSSTLWNVLSHHLLHCSFICIILRIFARYLKHPWEALPKAPVFLNFL